jgi:NAD(P)H-quinone oxidoreductase subunit 5
VSLTIAPALPLWHGALLLAPTFAALVAVAVIRRNPSAAAAWRAARAASVAMLVATGAVAIVHGVTGRRAGMVLRSDTVGVAMLLLVSFVGWVVIRYSEAYLAGDPLERRYVGRLIATIGAVTAVVVTNHLILLVLAWSATSLAMHGLLTFFGDRPVAVAVAHKKFVLARCADLSMVGAVVALGATFHTLRIDGIAAEAATIDTLPPGAHIGIALIAMAALLKCAQLPFHGWLIQVMEAPTPVSALLHAGVVNLGGFVLLRFAPVVDRATETRALLVGAGTITAVVAALVMTTRVSVKVSLAWSTCAQMGFMLMQCGLGLWEMALLHLLAHSLHKAHAFLAAGGTVRQTQRKQLAPKPAALTSTRMAISTATTIVVTFTAGWAWGHLPFSEPPSLTLWILVGIVALSIVPLVSAPTNHPGRGVRPTLIWGTIAVPVAYFALHELFARLIPHGPAAPTGLLIAVAGSFSLLFIVQVLCAVAPTSRLLRRLYPWIYGGLFLDEAFTRLVFSMWPPPTTRSRVAPLPQPPAAPVLASSTPERSLA